jgi:hypothetical protein
VTKSAHDEGCAALQSKKCDCEQGRLRKIKQRAKDSMKRRKRNKYNWWIARFFEQRDGDTLLG